MTEKLKPCPFCGAKRGLYVLLDGYDANSIIWRVFCDSCKSIMMNERAGTKEEIVAEWNRRDLGGEEGTNFEGYDFGCDACRFACDLPQPSYCPGCGAKVVGE